MAGRSTTEVILDHLERLRRNASDEDLARGGAGARIEDGVDSFPIHRGRIVSRTIPYSVGSPS